MSAYPTRSRYVPKLGSYPPAPPGGVCHRRFSADAANDETPSDGQLSPPFQFPQPLGAVAAASLGIEVGIMRGGVLGDTAPVPGGTVAVVEDTDRLVVDVVAVDDTVDDLELVAAVLDVAELIW